MKWGLAISEGILVAFIVIYVAIYTLNYEWIALFILIYTVSLAIYLFHIREYLSDLETLSKGARRLKTWLLENVEITEVKNESDSERVGV